MKSTLLTISSALTALVVLSVSAAAAGILFVATGIVAVFVTDYGRTILPLRVRAEIIPLSSNNRSQVCLPAAA
jgi:hypothetical protein